MELWEPWKRSHKAEDEQEFARYRGEGVTKLSPMDEAGSCSVWVQWPITKPELRSTQHKCYSAAKEWRRGTKFTDQPFIHVVREI